MAKKPVFYALYVCSLDTGHTNGVIAQFPNVELIREVRCADGVLRTMWRCDAETYIVLKEGRGAMGLRFRVFCSLNEDDPLKDIVDIATVARKLLKLQA